MGLYEREYYGQQQHQQGLQIRLPRSAVGWLILINVVIYLTDYFVAPAYYQVYVIEQSTEKPVFKTGFTANSNETLTKNFSLAFSRCVKEVDRIGKEKNLSASDLVSRYKITRKPASVGPWLSYTMSAKYDTLAKPYNIFQLITYAFAHSSTEFKHILFNMLVLFFFGRDVERVLGRGEFLRFYLVAAILGGLVWCLIALGTGNTSAHVVGASGAVVAVVVFYCFTFPNRMVLLFFIIPMPAWVLGVLFIALDIFGALGSAATSDNVAYPVHLAGAAFGIFYVNSGWRLSWLRWPDFLKFSGQRRPKIRLHSPDSDRYDTGRDRSDPDGDPYDTGSEPPSRESRREAKQQEREAEKKRKSLEEVDRILDKIQQQGQASLTRKEQAILEERSRELRESREKKDE